MRARREIELSRPSITADTAGDIGAARTFLGLLLEVALDIRGILQGQDKKEGHTLGPEKSTYACCSFCLKRADDCAKLVAGPCGFICDKCAPIAVECIVEKLAEENKRKTENGPNRTPEDKGHHQ